MLRTERSGKHLIETCHTTDPQEKERDYNINFIEENTELTWLLAGSLYF